MATKPPTSIYSFHNLGHVGKSWTSSPSSIPRGYLSAGRVAAKMPRPAAPASRTSKNAGRLMAASIMPWQRWLGHHRGAYFGPKWMGWIYESRGMHIISWGLMIWCSFIGILCCEKESQRLGLDDGIERCENPSVEASNSDGLSISTFPWSSNVLNLELIDSIIPFWWIPSFPESEKLLVSSILQDQQSGWLR